MQKSKVRPKKTAPKPKKTKPVVKQEMKITPRGKANNDRAVNSMNLAAGSNERVAPQPLVFPVPSDSLTVLRYKPNFVNIGIFADALTAAMMAKSNISTQFNPQVYNNFREKTVQVIFEGMSGAAVPSISPLPYVLAAVYHAYNVIKQGGPMPCGTRYKYQVVTGSNATPPPNVSFGAPDVLVDGNGFRKLPPYAPEGPSELNESFRTVLGTSDIRLWSVGDKPPKISNGVSQFATLMSGANVQGFNGQDTMANTHGPLTFPGLAGLGLVDLITPGIVGKFNTPLYGNPSLYAGYLCTHTIVNPRDRVVAATIDVAEIVVLTIGLMAGINSQAVKAGRPLIFENICPEYLTAQVLNCIASSQQKNFPMTMNITDSRGAKSVRAGTQFPPRDVASASQNLFHLLIVELMRRYSIISVKIPDEAFTGSNARLVMVPTFMVQREIFSVAMGGLGYAGITTSLPAADIEPTTWSEPIDGTPLTYATPNSFDGSAWNVYMTTYRNLADEIGQYSPQYPTTQQTEPGLCLTHFGRIYVDAAQARLTLDNAIIASAGNKQRRLLSFKEKVAVKVKAPGTATTQAFMDPNAPWATFTYALFFPNAVNFLVLPITRALVNLDSEADIVATATSQILGWLQITAVNYPIGYTIYKSLFETGKANVFSGTKDGATTELMKILMNRASAGLGGALDDDIQKLNAVARGIYGVSAKKPNFAKYDSVAKPVVDLAQSLTRPLRASYEYFMG